jgi:tetratricopeptide (TPR) repeat protein
MKNLIIFSFTILLLSSISYSQSKDDIIFKGIDYTYGLKFDSAETMFNQVIQRDTKDPTGYFFNTMMEWWKINLNRDDESNDNKYFDRVNKVIDLCDEKLDKNEDDDWTMFLKGGTLGYRGFLWSMRDNWLKAANDGREGLSLLQKSYEKNPNNKDVILGLGLYNYAVDYVLEAYPYLKALFFFFPKGNKQQGLTQLQQCAENGKFSKTEAKFVLAYLNITYEKNYLEAEKYSVRLFNQYPDNPIFHKYVGRCYAGLDRWSECLNIWTSILQKTDSNKFGYNNNNLRRETLYYIGLSQMRVLNNDEAIKYFEQCLNLSQQIDGSDDSSYKIFSALGLGMVWDRKGNHNEAIKYYEKVINMKDFENSHNAAKEFKEKGYK